MKLCKKAIIFYPSCESNGNVGVEIYNSLYALVGQVKKHHAILVSNYKMRIVGREQYGLHTSRRSLPPHYYIVI